MVVFFDIDGTIVDEETQAIPESTVRAVEKLKERGHIAVVNTGRPLAHIDPRVRKMAFSGWVCGCGMEVSLNGSWLYRKHPDPDLCRYVRDSVRDCGMQVLFETEDGAIVADGKNSVHPTAILEVTRMRAKGFDIVEIDDMPEPKFMKLVTYDWPGCDRAEFIRRMEPYFTCIDRGNTMIELVLKGCSKAGGMEELLHHLGVAKNDSMAIGDSTNDLPMFAVAGHTVCLGGGMEELKAEAEFITDTVMNDGIAKALVHFGLIESA